MTTRDIEGESGLHYSAVRRVLMAVLAANLFVTVVKIALGVVTGALAVVADGFHSLVDSSSNLIGLAAIRLAGRPADERHPYGYRRYETLGALAIGGLLLVAAWEIGRSILERLTQGSTPAITLLTLGLVIFTLPVNILIVVLEIRAGKRLKSEILLADAKHTQTDLYVTASVVLSLVGVWLGWAWLDLVVAAGVVIMILRAAFGILGDTAKWLADARVTDAAQVEAIAMSAPGVRYVHKIRSRGTPDAAFVDLHVKVDPGMSTSQAHAVASEVERRLVAKLPDVKDALVHIEPARANESPWDRMANDLRQIADGMGLGLHDLHIHNNLEGNMTLEMHLEMPGDVTLGEAHALADQFEERTRRRWPQAEQVVTHLEPLRQQVLVPGDAPDPQHEKRVRALLARWVAEEDLIEVRPYEVAGHLNVAVKLRFPMDTPLSEAHATTERLESELLSQIPELQRVTIHAEPEN